MTPTLASTLQLGDPVEHRGIVIAPLFPRADPRAAYVTLEDALPLGFRVTEIDTAGSVPELAVENPLDRDVLLYDGEELVGAKQNRILNVSVLVGAQSKTLIPVSCVEEGRWHSRSAHFAAARHTAHPELRRRKAERLLADPLARGVAQGEVWDEVRAKSARLDVHSPTMAQADVYVARDRDLGALRRAFPLAPGQCGAVLALGSAQLCLDYVSRPDAWSRLYPKVLEGYLLDALEVVGAPPASADTLADFAERVDAAPRNRRASAGKGEDVRLAAAGVVGSGLELDGELLQLSAFTTDGGPVRGSRIARPLARR